MLVFSFQTESARYCIVPFCVLTPLSLRQAVPQRDQRSQIAWCFPDFSQRKESWCCRTRQPSYPKRRISGESRCAWSVTGDKRDRVPLVYEGDHVFYVFLSFIEFSCKYLYDVFHLGSLIDAECSINFTTKSHPCKKPRKLRYGKPKEMHSRLCIAEK